MTLSALALPVPGLTPSAQNTPLDVLLAESALYYYDDGKYLTIRNNAANNLDLMVVYFTGISPATGLVLAPFTANQWGPLGGSAVYTAALVFKGGFIANGSVDSVWLPRTGAQGVRVQLGSTVAGGLAVAPSVWVGRVRSQ